MVYESKIKANTKEKLRAIVLCAMFAVSIVSIFGVKIVAATPTVPKTTPYGGLPVNVIWYNNAPASLPTGEMLDKLGWVWGDQLDSAHAFAMLMIQDGPAARWYVWIYVGGWDANWGYWSYGAVTHYHFDPNPFHWGWYLDDLEGPETKLRNQWATKPHPWIVSIDYYWVNNKGSYSGVSNDGYATRFSVSRDAYEFTSNSNFVKSLGRWDRCLYWFNWLGGNDGDDPDSNRDGRCDLDPGNHYVIWLYDGLVQLRSKDHNSFDTNGVSARFGQGQFHGTPSYQPILNLGNIRTLTMEAKVANWGCTFTQFPDWVGIKFDAWARNVYTGMKMMIEMYWLGYSINDPILGDKYRMVGSTLFDYIVALPNHREAVTELYWASNSKTYIINLYKFFKYSIESAAPWYDPTHDYRNGIMACWELYHVAIDLETSDLPSPYYGISTWCDANMLKVTYG